MADFYNQMPKPRQCSVFPDRVFCVAELNNTAYLHEEQENHPTILMKLQTLFRDRGVVIPR